MRLLRCSLLHADTYEEIEADPRSIGPAFAVVLLASLSAVVGAWLETLTWHAQAGQTRLGLVLEMSARGIEPIAFWLGGAAFAYMVGSSFFRGPDTETNYAEVLRTTGFAFSPGLLSFLVALPPPALGLAAMWTFRLWMLVTLMVAVRQALDFTTGRAIGTVSFGWVLGWLVMWGLVSVSVQVIGILA